MPSPLSNFGYYMGLFVTHRHSSLQNPPNVTIFWKASEFPLLKLQNKIEEGLKVEGTYKMNWVNEICSSLLVNHLELSKTG